MNNMDFIRQIADIFQKQSILHNYSLCSPMIAQACLETGYGVDKGSEIKVSNNNMLGIKYKENRVKSFSYLFNDGGWEVEKGQVVGLDTNTLWYGFDSIEQCAIGYYEFISVSWYDKVRQADNYKEYCYALKECGYATDPNYAEKLIDIIEKNDLTKYDEKGNGTMAKHLIALSDGHGAETPGKRTPYIASLGREIRENEFNREVTKYLDVALKRCGFDTLLVAPTDADTPLADRVNLANSKKADAYISNHYNASDGRFDGESIDASGTEVWCWGDANGTRLATLVYNEIIQGTTQKGRGVKVSKSFYELSKTNMIAIIIENGFMDNEREAMLMLNVDYQKEQAEQQCKGICKYFGVAYVEETKPTVPTVPTAPTVPAKGMYEISLSEIKTKGYDGITIVE